MHSPILMRGNTSFLALLLGASFVLAGCTKTPETTDTAETTPTSDSESASSTSGTTTQGPASDSTPMTSSPTSTDPTSDTSGGTGSTGGCNFIDCQDGGMADTQCDIWAQDCPEDEKCMPWANDGGNAWNATKCSPIDPDAALIGDECDGGGVSGEDNCELASMCYYVDSETQKGVCVPFCVGSPDEPSCNDLNDQCSISNDGVLILCRKTCNPLLQDCLGSASCLGAAGSDQFVCIADASGEAGAPGDPCEYLNACDPGLFCAAADFVPECVASGCCTEFCDIDDPNKDDSCSQKDLGVSCEAYWNEGEEPPGLENLGACILPAP